MSAEISSARTFVLCHGRLLERRRFELLFGADDRQLAGPLVLQAVLAYQNPDGGFGNALEPDVRCSASQTVCAEVALRTMLELDVVDDAAIRRLCDWCAENGFDGGALPFALPTITSGPRAPWWQPTDHPSLNPTAALVGLLTELGTRHDWIDRARGWCWGELEANVEAIDHHGALCAIGFLETAPSDARTRRVADAVRDRVLGGLVELDPDAPGYVFSPLQFARSPRSLARPWFDDATIDTHLDALAASQRDDGGWPVTWEPPSAAALSEWRAIRTIEALQTLRAYDRV